MSMTSGRRAARRRVAGVGGEHGLAGPTHWLSGQRALPASACEPQQERRVVQHLAARPSARSGSPETNMPNVCSPSSNQSASVISRPRVDPGEVLGAALDGRAALEEVPLPQGRVLTPQPQRGLGDLVEVEPGVVGVPVHPGDLVVVAVGVVVAALGAAALVAGGDHGTPVDRHNVAIRLAACLRRSARTAASSVSPSTPQFQERLLSVPSRLSSPLATLCLPL